VEQPGRAETVGTSETPARANGINGRAGTGGQDGEEAGHGGGWWPEPAVGRVANELADQLDEHTGDRKR